MYCVQLRWVKSNVCLMWQMPSECLILKDKGTVRVWFCVPYYVASFRYLDSSCFLFSDTPVWFWILRYYIKGSLNVDATNIMNSFVTWKMSGVTTWSWRGQDLSFEEEVKEIQIQPLFFHSVLYEGIRIPGQVHISVVNPTLFFARVYIL